MESESGNIQNDFFNTARRERTVVTIFLADGRKLVGRIRSFDKFTLLVEGNQGEQIIFKHAISTVNTSSTPADKEAMPPAGRHGETAERRV